MTFFLRNIIICEIKALKNQGEQDICYVPELACLQGIRHKLVEKTQNKNLLEKLNQLAQFQEQYEVGALPFNLTICQSFIEELYNDLLNNNIPLPHNIIELDLQYIIEDYECKRNHISTHEVKLKVQRQNLTFFAKYLPWVGRLVTVTLTLGVTVSSMFTVLGWGWSLLLFALFGMCKLLTTYADIAGGPERRMLLLGIWLDRMLSGYYDEYGKYSFPKIVLQSSVMIILACSSLLTWYGAWCLIRELKAMSYVPNYIAASIAGMFAWSSAGASFGRIYQDLYQLLFTTFSSRFSFDIFKVEEKISLKKLDKCFTYSECDLSEKNSDYFCDPFVPGYQLQLALQSKGLSTNSSEDLSDVPRPEEQKRLYL